MVYTKRIGDQDFNKRRVAAADLTPEAQAAREAVFFSAGMLLIFGVVSLVGATLAFYAAATGARGFKTPPPTLLFASLGAAYCCVTALSFSGIPRLLQLVRWQKECQVSAKRIGQHIPSIYWPTVLIQASLLVSISLLVVVQGLSWSNSAIYRPDRSFHVVTEFLKPLAFCGLAIWTRTMRRDERSG